MIDFATARRLVIEWIATVKPIPGEGPLVIDGSRIIDCDVAWLFFWTTAARLVRNDLGGLTGNNPIFVTKDDGTLYVWSLREPLEVVVERLRSNRSSLQSLVIPTQEDLAARARRPG